MHGKQCYQAEGNPMLPAVVEYFYEVEAAFSSDSNTANFGFDGQQVSVEEIMVSFLCLTAFRNTLARLLSRRSRNRYFKPFALS